MRASVNQYFEDVSEAYDIIDLRDIERRTSIIIEDPVTITDQHLLKLLHHSNIILQDSLNDVNPVLELIKYSSNWDIEENYLLVFKKTLLIRLEQNAAVLIYPRGCER